MLVETQRNASALFGAGLIDRIPERALIEVAAEQARTAKAQVSAIPTPTGNSVIDDLMKEIAALRVRGRVPRLKDSRIGRFGWKGNLATLRESTMQACSSELGLEVPGFPRAVPPWKKDYKAPGIDLTNDQCDTLASFVASLPRPRVRPPDSPQQAREIEGGHNLFAKIGCATCHRQKLSDVDGIYSDLLLHDMGPSLSDAGSYTVITAKVVSGDNSKPSGEPIRAANDREW
jgi:CxxC motif-containing protein (DUF1111 family)